MQLGGKYSFSLSKDSSLYMNALWQHEFKTEASATYRGLSTPFAAMKGSSGSLGLGWRKEAGASSPWFIDMQGSGWFGKQRDFTVQAIAGCKF